GAHLVLELVAHCLQGGLAHDGTGADRVCSDVLLAVGLRLMGRAARMIRAVSGGTDRRVMGGLGHAPHFRSREKFGSTPVASRVLGCCSGTVPIATSRAVSSARDD